MPLIQRRFLTSKSQIFTCAIPSAKDNPPDLLPEADSPKENVEDFLGENVAPKPGWLQIFLSAGDWLQLKSNVCGNLFDIGGLLKQRYWQENDHHGNTERVRTIPRRFAR